MELETERLRLRPVSLEDLEVFAAFYSDPEQYAIRLSGRWVGHG